MDSLTVEMWKQIIKTDMEDRKRGLGSSFGEPKDDDTDFPEIFERELERRAHDS